MIILFPPNNIKSVNSHSSSRRCSGPSGTRFLERNSGSSNYRSSRHSSTHPCPMGTRFPVRKLGSLGDRSSRLRCTSSYLRCTCSPRRILDTPGYPIAQLIRSLYTAVYRRTIVACCSKGRRPREQISDNPCSRATLLFHIVFKPLIIYGKLRSTEHGLPIVALV